MRLETLLRTAYPSTGDTKQMKYSANHINGLLLTSVGTTEDAVRPWLLGDMITVTLRDRERTDVLVQRMPVLLLAYLSAINHGFDFDTAELLRQITARIEADNSNTSIFNTIQAFPILIPLGSLYLTDAEIDITFESSASAGAERKIGFYAYKEASQVDYVKKYRLINDTSTHIGGVYQGFLTSFFATSVQISQFAYDCQVTVKVNGESWSADSWGLSGFTNAAMGNNGIPVRELALFYQSDDEVGDSVHVTLSGANDTDTRLFIVEHAFYPDRVKRGEQKRLIQLENKVRTMEVERPLETAAVQEAGLLPSTKELAQVSIS